MVHSGPSVGFLNCLFICSFINSPHVSEHSRVYSGFMAVLRDHNGASATNRLVLETERGERLSFGDAAQSRCLISPRQSGTGFVLLTHTSCSGRKSGEGSKFSRFHGNKPDQKGKKYAKQLPGRWNMVPLQGGQGAPARWLDTKERIRVSVWNHFVHKTLMWLNTWRNTWFDEG